ncbi:MAG: metallophosphoesterase [Clostridia bacterium]|nr:metallophosphoesterase [Clostridia bacterium]
MSRAVRIGVLSDTHRDEAAIRQVLKRLLAAGPLDALCFLGDCAADLRVIEANLPQGHKTAVYAVRGNNDVFAAETDELTVSLGGKKLLLTHGHRQRVKMHRLGLLLHAREQGADVALFGHTHRPECRYEQGILLLNPGAACRANPAWAELVIRDGVVTPRQFTMMEGDEV